MFSCAYRHGSASIAALAGGEIGANRPFVLPSLGVVSSASGDNAILLLPLQQMCSLRQCHFR
jgi:hypothetical protein